MAESAVDSQVPELPSDVWVLIGSHLGARDLARFSTVIKGLGGVELHAMNLAHILTQNNKAGEECRCLWHVLAGSDGSATIA
ncbi:hypothetical protein COCOBI_17-3290 [Coccomyxa sp. Obi]|nr:hypothetical protein COCOBI_17-3290 [Coccomyxa sp. Obi]